MILKNFILIFLLLNFTLQLKKSWLLEPEENFEPSDLTFYGGKLMTVSDKTSDIYVIDMDNENSDSEEIRYAHAHVFLQPAKKFLKNYSQKAKLKLDFEGICVCDDHFYIADERNRNILEVKENGETRKLNLDFSQYNQKMEINPFGPEPNAGFEGIACDSAGKTLYVINERNYRHIYVVDLAKEEIVDNFDVPSGNRLPCYVDKIAVTPDYSAAYFFQGHLYLLYRNEHKIIKVDPQKKVIVAEASFEDVCENLYETTEPFGLEEGVAITQNSIFIVSDNNGCFLQKDKNKKNPILFEFARPEGF